jgi:hypothetical protein
MEPDLLVETNVEILDQVRKDLTREYLRLMSHALQVSRRPQAGDGSSASNSDVKAT